MATTTLLQRHAGEGETIAEAIRDCLDYGKDPEKTERLAPPEQAQNPDTCV